MMGRSEMRQWGPPPRGRGKDFRCLGKRARSRITPAWAGKSGLRFYSAAVCQDHPRMGGEKLTASSIGKRVEGSPPRGRGKVLHSTKTLNLPRITPAWAGKRQTAAMPRTMTRDHPRMGREKTMYFEDKYFCRGSPPRGRGKVELVQLLVVGDRITPAWAGKRSPLTASKPTFWDHPRMGGEKVCRSVSRSSM